MSNKQSNNNVWIRTTSNTDTSDRMYKVILPTYSDTALCPISRCRLHYTADNPSDRTVNPLTKARLTNQSRLVVNEGWSLKRIGPLNLNLLKLIHVLSTGTSTVRQWWWQKCLYQNFWTIRQPTPTPLKFDLHYKNAVSETQISHILGNWSLQWQRWQII